jgi:hypothetical protein
MEINAHVIHNKDPLQARKRIFVSTFISSSSHFLEHDAAALIMEELPHTDSNISRVYFKICCGK